MLCSDVKHMKSPMTPGVKAADTTGTFSEVDDLITGSESFLFFAKNYN